MRKDKLEFKIITDSNGKKIELDNLTVEAAQALMVFVESLTKIAEQSSNPEKVKISVTPGSACVALEAPEEEIREIENEMKVVSRNKSTKKAFVEPLRAMQVLISNNGLGYEANVIKNNHKTPILDLFKQKRRFQLAPKEKIKSEFSIAFFDGKLIEVGGKNPNIHILINDKKQTVSCSEEQARKVNSFLYNDIKISAWEQKVKGQKSVYTFCDNYVNDSLYDELKVFVDNNLQKEGTAPLKDIHYKLRDYFNSKKFGEANKLIKLFCNDNVDIGRLRTILVIAKSFRDNDKLKESLSIIENVLQDKIEKPLV